MAQHGHRENYDAALTIVPTHGGDHLRIGRAEMADCLLGDSRNGVEGAGSARIARDARSSEDVVVFRYPPTRYGSCNTTLRHIKDRRDLESLHLLVDSCRPDTQRQRGVLDQHPRGRYRRTRTRMDKRMTRCSPQARGFRSGRGLRAGDRRHSTDDRVRSPG
jgi:hypothetical protein